MKAARTFTILFILALLLSNASTTRHYLTRAAEPQANTNLSVTTVKALHAPNRTDVVEHLPTSAFNLSSTSRLGQSSAGDWDIECVDCSTKFWEMSNRNLRLDSNGHPHIVYGETHLRYAWHDGTKWNYETVDESFGVGAYASLALDGTDRPHISYYDGSNDDLKYAWHDGAVWHIETVDSEGYVGHDASLALDEAGRPHISYYDCGIWNLGVCESSNLKYAWHDGLGWHIETVDSEGYVGFYTSLALDGADRPHISYFGSGDLKYAWHDGVTWHIEIVDSEKGVGGHTSLALDEAGQPHISYIDWSNDDLKYAWNDGMVWHIETVDSEERVDTRTSLALDEAGQPHISYNVCGGWDDEFMFCYNYNLKYAWRDGTVWHIETVDNSGIYASLALDQTGRPHISYYGNGVKYTWHDGAAWHIETVEEARNVDVGMYTSLALDGTDRPHISYHDWNNRDLKYTWHDGATWHIETVDSKNVGSYTSLVLDGADRPHISYYGNGVKYTWHDGAAWHIEAVESEESVGGYTSLALDGAERPNISYCGNWDLKYAWHDGLGWHIETVDSEGYVGLYTSLALDGADRPHISYHDQSNSDLKYAWHDGSDWYIETVDSEGDIGTTSLALDGTDRPHIIYCGNWDLKYAWYDGLGWHIETVDSEGYVCQYNSLALDWMGHPHISYYGDGDLKYAWRDGSGWQIETVDSEGDVGEFSSLTLDGANRPHISYYDEWYGDLRYAQLMPLLSLNKQATPRDNLRNNEALTYTLTLSGASPDARLWDPLPSAARYVSGSITSTLAPPAVYSPTIGAIVWQGVLPLHTTQVIRFQVTQGITGSASLSLSLPIVNTAWLTDTESGDSVSATVVVNGWRVYLPLTVRKF